MRRQLKSLPLTKARTHAHVTPDNRELDVVRSRTLSNLHNILYWANARERALRQLGPGLLEPCRLQMSTVPTSPARMTTLITRRTVSPSEGGRAPGGRRKSYLERCHVPLPRKGGSGAAVKKLLQNEERTRLSPYYTNMSTETEARLRELALTAAGGQGPEIRQPSQSLFFGMSAAVPCFCPSDPSSCT